ncbi:phosphatidylinositol 4-phosphate 3-kinase C2 domain-containing subunit alpha-like [Sinocyclocheilus grahami]|uniref:phosphatidylinositol 4-phosphate 3-kinase C2 domain-containing subunit alpha-like n=1 Tax=Sinocyclocheilus grahami TaxID=75366 RepID=UPI0007AD50A9|nr:PREDICTED: phosphatidylinositol 4-phosphate 3-kinase C2 domain-containing subunit alpha-like [Sinocyclocheilus grahami]
MAHISSGNGFKFDRPASPGVVRPKGIVGKEEALRMELEALDKIKREKRHTLPATAPSGNPLPNPSAQTSTSRQEKDLIVFSESETQQKEQKDKFEDIDLEKLTKEELEKLLLDDSFGVSKMTRPSSLLGCNLSASYPGGHAFSPSSFHWTPTPTHAQTPMFPSAPFPKPPCSFQNGFSLALSPFISLPAQPTPFLSFTPIQPPAALVYPQPAVTPEMAKLFDKIASTSEYLKNGRSSSMETESGSVKSLEPIPQPSEPPNISRFEWLDLDPLNKRKEVEVEEKLTVSSGPFVEESGTAKDPWDAVLLDEPEVVDNGSPSAQVKSKVTLATQPRRASTGAAVTRSQSLNIPATSTDHSPGKQINKGSTNVLSKYSILEKKEGQNLEVVAFCEDISKLRSKFTHDDLATNPGYVLSPVINQRDAGGDNGGSVKVSIEISVSQQPVTFTCDVSSPVDLLIMQALCWVHDDLNQVDISSYVLKVCGQEEVLQNKHSLGSHEYVQNCRKWETEIKLQLLFLSTMRRDLARTAEDDISPIVLEKYLGLVERPFKESVTREVLAEQLEGYYKQVNLCLQNESTQYKTVDNVVQSVKNLCCALDEVETPAISDAIKKLKRSVNLPRTRSPEAGAMSSASTGSANGYASPIEESLAGLTDAVYELAKLYLRSFCPTTPGYTMEEHLEDRRDSKEASGTTEHLQFTLFAVHGIPATWVSSFEKYYLMCALTHNNRNLFKPVQSKKVGAYKSFFYHIKWDESINFPISVALLPLEAMLSLSLYGVLNQNANNSPDSNKQRKGPELLGKVSMPLLDFRRVLSRGSQLLSLWTSQVLQPGAAGKGKNPSERIILQVDFPSPAVDVLYVGPQENGCPDPQSLDPLDPGDRSEIEKLCAQASAFGLSRADKQLLWDQRYYCRDYQYSLPKILASAPSWDWGSMGEIHSLLHHWPPLSPVSALELLDSKFADTEVRKVAVSWIESSSDDELADYLPQLVWMVLLEGLERVQSFFQKNSCRLPITPSLVAKELNVKACSFFNSNAVPLKIALVNADPLGDEINVMFKMVLLEGLERVQSFFQKNSCRLPISPSLVTKELNIKACSFFNSNAVPLKIALVNADPLGDEINVMFKVGEDLRQDMLALQMIRIMDRIWLQEGLDLRIVNFKCISTGKDKGMVELVPSSETLRKIQVEYGVTGSFKDKPLAEWLRKYNPAEDEYEKASENFIYTCAGCCVATYILGICDRHNDNIMLRSTGHMFHIDFGKFLGHAQMIGSFKRDRAPFVLTSDMAYVINGGERPTSRFQLFVDLCSQAYNLIRKHSNLFLNLLSLMTQSGLPELTGVQDLKYVYDALQPQTTDAEATIFFTRLIESSLGSVATKFNFFIHNLAQLRFSGLPSNDEPILSFAPRTYTMKQDGRIRDASVFFFHIFQTYVIRILREGQNEPQFVFRTFDEFQELHNKLTILFPLWKLPGFPSKMVLGRTHIKDVASKRKVELSSYVHNLMRSSTEVTQCDLIYTFFHPIARDDKTEGVEGLSKTPDMPPVSPTTGRVEGEVKLSVSYRNSTLFIMVMHIKDLISNDGADPNPYVKTYLLPDPHKTSKRKTKIARKTRNPTFNEMLVYSGYSKETLKQRELQLSVLSAESLRENCYLGGITLSLKDFDLSRETVKWYKLTTVPYF